MANSSTVTPDGSSKFDLPDGVRKTLSNILILHPVAAGVTLIMLIMAGASHTHGASHSARYLLILFVFILLAFLITIVAFVIDIILFLPHMAFGTYLVLAAAVLIAVSGVVAFAMRRTIVSRKARKQKIAENAEMSGENFYNREGLTKPMDTFSSVPAVPSVSGANGGADGLPAFASFESSRRQDDQMSDERIPLTQVRTADRSTGTNASDLANSGPSRSASRDRYGNPPADAYGQQYGGPNGRPRGGPSGYRGGGAPRGRGGYPPMRGRGGYGPPGRGGMGPRGRGGPYGQGPPRDGYAPAMGAGAMAGAAMGRGGRSGYGRRPSGGEQYDAYNQQPGQGEYGWGSQSNPSHASNDADLPRAESPPPLPGSSSANAFGQPVEMDTGGAELHHGYGAPPTNTNPQDDVNDATGMTAMNHHPGPRPGYVSDGSKYSTDEYVPPRAAWTQGSGRKSPGGQSPVNTGERRSPAVEYRGGPGPTSPPAGPSASGGYYEDVEPRYETSGPHPALIASPPEPAFEDPRSMDGSRSPVGSERSNFTSVSQRGVNPRWNPQPPMPHGNGARRAVQQRQDMLLDNPDFQLAGGRSGKPKHGTPAGLVPGSAYPNAPI